MWVKITLLIIALSIFITAWSQSVEMTINEDKVENKVKVRNKLGIYNTMSLLMGFPSNSFRTSYDKNVLWGFNLDLVFTPIKKITFGKLEVRLICYSDQLKRTFGTVLKLRHGVPLQSLTL